MLALGCILTLTGCGSASSVPGDGIENMENPGEEIQSSAGEAGETQVLPAQEETMELTTMKVQENTVYQTFNGFGASSCWWSQYVGGWDNVDEESGLPVREKIAKLLYSREDGIGLSIYRYNVGAGSADTGTGNISDPHRRAESFLTEDGSYHWEKDANAVWFMKKCVEEGAEQVIFFCNSPQVSMTRNGLAHMDEGSTDNLDPEQYEDFATYVFDVAEHFSGEGIPVTAISPINEPQWEWVSGQEGCHYTPEALVAVLKTFLQELRERGLEETYEITAPEGGEWKSSTENYIDAMMADEELASYFTVIDGHSYWSDKATKMLFMQWLEKHHPELKIAMSEWCEMVNGRDYTMDSAFNLADQIWEDLTILNAVSWQYWVAVADGDYRDGLIYVNVSAKTFEPNRRLWAMGNYSKFIRPGYERVEIEDESNGNSVLKPVAFSGVNTQGEKELVCVFINRGEKERIAIQGENEYSTYEIYTTSQEQDLVQTASGTTEEANGFEIPGESVVTVVLR